MRKINLIVIHCSATRCNACSLKELCLPVLYQRADPKAYLRAHLDEMQEAAP